MNPEQFHDAMNYLDDDLIAETDELRQGKRVRQPRSNLRRIIPWAAAAACLALVVGIGSGVLPIWQTSDSAILRPNMENGQPFEPGKAGQDYQSISDSEFSMQESVTDAWEIYTCGQFSISIPEGWTSELESGEDGSLFMVIRPPRETGAIKVGYQPGFGVCGTGLTEKQVTIAGREALAGYYDGSSQWSFIAFTGTDYVILKDGADAWWPQYRRTAEKILDTFVIED